MLDRIFQRWLDRDDPLMATLRKVPLFGRLSRREMKDVMEMIEESEFDAGEMVFEQGTPGNGVYVVITGGVDIVQTDEETGDRLHLSRSEAGAFFGETALLDDAPRTATAMACEDARLVLFPRSALLTLAEQRPHLGVKIAMQLSQIIAERLRHTNRALRTARDEVEAAEKAREEASEEAKTEGTP